MTPKDAVAFIRQHGVVLASAEGPVPRLAEAVAGAPIKGSWWAHPSSHEIFAVFQAVAASPDILVCRLVDGKITFVHRRLWPALVRAASRFPKRHLAQTREEHTARGHHVTHDVPFPDWVPAAVLRQARTLSEPQALAALGAWTAAGVK